MIACDMQALPADSMLMCKNGGCDRGRLAGPRAGAQRLNNLAINGGASATEPAQPDCAHQLASAQQAAGPLCTATTGETNQRLADPLWSYTAA
jgi:hypothetical protein